MDNETLDPSLHSAMVTSIKPMVHRDWHIANGIPASRVLDNPQEDQINLHLASQARSYATIRQPSDSTHHQLRRKKAKNRPQATRRRSDGAASIKPTRTHAKPSLVCTLSRLLTRNHVSPSPRRSCRNTVHVCIECRSPASDYCAVLTLEIILRICLPFACV
jgi:hypothetical protein